MTSVSADKVLLLHLKRRMGTPWAGVYFDDVLHGIATPGTTFKDKNALITGVGKGSKVSCQAMLMSSPPLLATAVPRNFLAPIM